SALVANNFRLDDHAALTLPPSRRVLSLSIHMGGTAGASGLPPCFDHQSGGSARQTDVFSPRHDIVAALGPEQCEERRGANPTVHPHESSATRERFPPSPQQAAQDPDGPEPRGRVAGPQ